MRHTLRFLLIILLGAVGALINSCDEDEEQPEPTITSFTPANGTQGVAVTITGTNFSSVPADNVIKFNGTTSVVTASTTTSITTTVPGGATSGTITVDVGGKTATSTTSFTVDFPPTITSFTPTTGVQGSSVTVTGTNFSATPANNVVKFNGTAAVVSASTTTSITTNVPNGTTSGTITVAVGLLSATSATSFTVALPPAITSFAPTNGVHGATVTITGTNFSATPTSNVVKFNGTAAVVAASTATSITTTVPNGATSGTITVEVSGGKATSATSFTVDIQPTISSFSPTVGVAGSPVTITGTNFSATLLNNTVKFNGTVATVTASTTTSITTSVPNSATSGTITVEVAGKTATSASPFTVTVPPTITGFAPTNGVLGSTVTITGTNFSATPANNIVKFNGTTTVVTASSTTSITTTVPNGATSGTITVEVGGAKVTSATSFTVDFPPTITSFTPTSGAQGTSVTITGTNFSVTPADNVVKFNGTSAVVTASTATSITTSVPNGATSGTIAVEVGGKTATSPTSFTVILLPAITSFAPANGVIGSTITITGTNFSATPADNVVKFNGTTAAVTASTTTSITTTVPIGATSGTITVETGGGKATSATSFTVDFPPTITSFTPTSGVQGTSVEIAGTNFSATPANNVVKFNGTTAAVTVSTTTSITTTVPNGATPGTISVEVGGLSATSATPFTVIFPPAITSFSPTNGPQGAAVTITGTNFSATTANNIVKFNGTSAVVTASTTTSISTTVPTGSTSGSITVEVSGNMATSATPFTVNYPPTLTSFTPNNGVQWDVVTITGANFSTTPADNIVKFNGTAAEVTASTTTSITAAVPINATSGTISVEVAGLPVTSAATFRVDLLFTATLNGAKEVPTNASAATGTARLVYNKDTKILKIVVTHTGLTPNNGHIHKGAVGVSGGVIFGFSGVATSPINYTSAALTVAQEADLIGALYYVNLHTVAFPNGEIRGQLVKPTQ